MFKRLLVILCLLTSFTELTPAFQRAVQRARQAAGRAGNILRTGLENRAGQVPRARTFPQARQPYTNSHPAQAATHATAASAAMHAQNREEFRARQHQLTSDQNGSFVLDLTGLEATSSLEESADYEEDTDENQEEIPTIEEDWEAESELRPLRSETHSATPRVTTENESGLAALLTSPAPSSHVVNRFQRPAQNPEARVQEQEAAPERPGQAASPQPNGRFTDNEVMLDPEQDEPSFTIFDILAGRLDPFPDQSSPQTQAATDAPGPEVASQNQLALAPYQGARDQAAEEPEITFYNLEFPTYTHGDHYFVDNTRTGRMDVPEPVQQNNLTPAETDRSTALSVIPENMRSLLLSATAGAGAAGAALARRNPAQARQAFSRATRLLPRNQPLALPAPAQPRTLPRPAAQPRVIPAGQSNLLLNEGALQPDMVVPPRRPLQLEPGVRSRIVRDATFRDVTPPALPQQQVSLPRSAAQPLALPAPAQPRALLSEGAPYIEIMPRRQTEPLQLNPGAPRRTIIDVEFTDINTPQPRSTTQPRALPAPVEQPALPAPAQPRSQSAQQPNVPSNSEVIELVDSGRSDNRGRAILVPRQEGQIATQPRALPEGQPNLLLNEGALQPDMVVPPRRPLTIEPGARPRIMRDTVYRDITPNELGDINAQSPTRPGVLNRFDATPRQQPLLPAPRQPMALPEPTPQARPALVPLPVQAEAAPESILLREMHARNEQRAEQQAREQAEREAQAQRDAEQQRLERETRERLEQETRDRVERERAEQQAREQAERDAQAQRDAEQQRLERETRERLEQETQNRLARERTEQQAREQAEREAQERLERENRARQEAEAQAQRDAEARAQEIRNRETQERLAREQAQREREAQERLEREARERLEQETRDRVERERLERETQHRLARERAEQQAREQAERELQAQRDAEIQALRDRENQQRLDREAQTRAEEQTPRAPRIPRTARRGNFINTNRPGFAPRMPLTQRPIIHTAAAFPHPEQTPPTQTAATPLEEFLPTMVRNNNNNPVPDLPTDQDQAAPVQDNQSTETQTDTTPKEEKPVKDRPVIEEEDDDDDEISPATQKTKKKKKSPQPMPADLDTPEEAQAPSRARSAKPKQAQPQYDADRLGRNTGDGVTILEDNHPANRILATPQEKTPPTAIISTVAGTEHGSTGQGQETHLFIPKPCPNDKIYKKDKRPGMLQYEKSDVHECYKLQEADVTATYSDIFKEIFDRLKNLANSLFETLVGPTRP